MLSPYADVKRSLLFKNSSLLSFEVGGSTYFGLLKQLHTTLKTTYEIPIRHTNIRPNVSLRYDYYKSMGETQYTGIRNRLTVELGATF